MPSFFQKYKSSKAYYNLALRVGNSIRNQMIHERKFKSLDRSSYMEPRTKPSTPLNPEAKIFWQNPYKTQKKRWHYTQSGSMSMIQKKYVKDFKKQQTQRFKQKLKDSLQKRQYTMEDEHFMNHNRAKQLRCINQSCLKQKLDVLFYQKQHDAQVVRRSLEARKMQAKILKRQKQLQLQFKKWHRQQENLVKHRNKILRKQNLKTVL